MSASRRLAGLARAAVKRLGLDLSSAVVLTEAATGAYAVTASLAALSGADRVYAVVGSSPHDDVNQARDETLRLAGELGVTARVEIVPGRSRAVVAQADVVTNSGRVRPIDADLIAWMKPTAVVSLMYEAWELRAGDVDVTACSRAGIAVAGTDERHPDVDVFGFLGVMAVRLLTDAGVAVHGTRVLLLCDNAFASFIEAGLTCMGAVVDLAPALPRARTVHSYDAIVVACRPRQEPVLSAEEARAIAEAWPDAVVAQFWGDVDRAACREAGVPVWPTAAPRPGHMGILPSAIGPDPVVRLQAAGLKVGEILWRARRAGQSLADSLSTLRGSGYGTLL
jgi:hypothetical protein